MRAKFYSDSFRFYISILQCPGGYFFPDKSVHTSLSLSSASCSLRRRSMAMSQTWRHFVNKLPTRGFLNTGSGVFLPSRRLQADKQTTQCEYYVLSLPLEYINRPIHVWLVKPKFHSRMEAMKRKCHGKISSFQTVSTCQSVCTKVHDKSATNAFLSL